jgi:hypothetical protein
VGVYPIHKLVGAVDLLDKAIVVDCARPERIDTGRRAQHAARAQVVDKLWVQRDQSVVGFAVE